MHAELRGFRMIPLSNQIYRYFHWILLQFCYCERPFVQRTMHERRRTKHLCKGAVMSDSPQHIETRATGSYDQRDSLTGLRGYYALLNDVESHAGDDVYVILCDVDNFRLINAAYGEKTGDVLLQRIGKAVRTTFGDKHTFRFGSDEFLVVNSFFDEDAMLEKVEGLQRRLAAIDYEGKPLRLSCSFGFAHGRIANSDDLREGVRFADRKVFEAKRLGKARAVGTALEIDPRFLAEGHEHVHGYKSYETDELTGLANLVHFRNTIGDYLDALASGEEPEPELGKRPTLVYFNVENFKAYNQHFGFDAGDALLISIAESIEEAFPNKMAARFSADQFMVAATEDEVVDGIEAVRAAFRKRHKDSSIWLRAGYYVVTGDNDDDAGVVCDRAKMACDSLKGRRDQFFREYDEELKRQILRRRYVLDNFTRALREGWIKPFYQPIVRVATGHVCDVEALARWIDPVEGLISPADFIPALEDARLIHKLDLQVLRCVCEDCARLRNQGRQFIPPSINLSRLDFELCDIVAEVEALLAEYDIPRDMISVEVTESALMGNQNFLKDEVDRFRSDGFEVWMDDFGSGYSSLNVLKDYKFDLIKIDMVFLRGFEDVEESRIMLSHVIHLAKELGFQTLVEGVETQEQFDFLCEIGCGRAQGYFIGKPLCLDDSISDSKSGIFPEAELVEKRSFYDKIGRIDLVRPDPADSVDGHYLPSDVAACIIRRHNGRYDYLNTNKLYAKFLQDVKIGTTADSEVVINDPDNLRRTNFVNVIERCIESGEWEHYTVDVANAPLLVRMKMIAQNPKYDAMAVLSIVEPVSNLLHVTE